MCKSNPPSGAQPPDATPEHSTDSHATGRIGIGISFAKRYQQTREDKLELLKIGSVVAGQIQDTEARQRVEREAIRVFTAWRGIVHSRLLDPITPEEQLAWLVAVHDWAIPNGLAGQPLVSTGFENVRCTVAHKAFMDAVEYLTLKDIRRLSGWEPVQLEIASLTDEVRKLNETIVERNELARTSLSIAGPNSQIQQAGTPQTAESNKIAASLDREDVAILKALQTRGTALPIVDISEHSKVGQKTVGKRLRSSKLRPLVQKPNGPKGGTSITELGRQVLDSLGTTE